MRQQWQRTAITITTVATIVLRPSVEAQAQRRPDGVLQRGAVASDTARRIPSLAADSLAFGAGVTAPQERGEPRGGLRVGWTIAGAVVGYLWWQSHRTEGNMMEPVEVVFLVGLGALVGTIVGLILD